MSVWGRRIFGLVAPAATTAAAAVTAAATTGATAATAATAAIFTRAGLVDRQAAAVHFLAAQRRDGGLGLGIAAHFDETEPLGPPGVAVHDHLRRLHRAVRLEHALQ